MQPQEPVRGERRKIQRYVADPIINIAKDTFSNKRQLIVFVNTKRGAESQAEKISTKCDGNPRHQELSQLALKALSTPTKQCRRLAKCLAKGVAFHHAGLHSKQREIIEESFRNREIYCICATPTLAAGVDLPAFRVIIRDLKRYGGPWGMSSIPVLEYEQQAGRAGRPGQDPWGEAICIAKDENEAEKITEEYLHGAPEEILSKLAVEPVLRTYVLSLVASEYVEDKQSLYDFFAQTFYAHQYGDMDKLKRILDMMIEKLEEWEFLSSSAFGDTASAQKKTQKKKNADTEGFDGFTSAADLLAGETGNARTNNEQLKATPIGKRVSELYLDPYTAHHLMNGFRRSTAKPYTTFALIHLAVSTLEMRPYLNLKNADYETVDEKLAVEEDGLLHLSPARYSDEYDDYLKTIKTAMLLESWSEEANEDWLLENYGATPGELHAKLQNIDWIIYASTELARMMSYHQLRGELLKLRTRLKNGAKEELLPLLRLKDVGRIRARKLHDAGVRDVAGLQRIDASSLGQLVGKAVAIKLKGQVGQKIDDKDVQIKPRKRKGQIALTDWS